MHMYLEATTLVLQEKSDSCQRDPPILTARAWIFSSSGSATIEGGDVVGGEVKPLAKSKMEVGGAG